MSKTFSAITFVSLLTIAGPLYAADGNMHGHDGGDGHYQSDMNMGSGMDMTHGNHGSGMDNMPQSDMDMGSDMDMTPGNHGSGMGNMPQSDMDMGSNMDMAHGNHGPGMDNSFLVKQNIDGYDVSFHVMKATPGQHMGGSHDFMVKVEKDGKALTNIVMNTKVIHPNGKSESKKTMIMGDWLMAGYDLGHEGKHQMMILFKTADGKKHKGGVYYPGK